MGQQHTLGRTATTVRTVDGWVEVQYHSTIIVKFCSKQIILNSGGWHTVTTKTRMNQASNQFGLDYGVFQKDYKWFVTYKGKTFEFVDGIIFPRE